MAGSYNAGGLYDPEALGGLSVTRFAEAVRAEGSACRAGVNKPLHLHPLFNTCDIYGHGRPTRLAHSDETFANHRVASPSARPSGRTPTSSPSSSATGPTLSSSTPPPIARSPRTTHSFWPAIPATRLISAAGTSASG